MGVGEGHLVDVYLFIFKSNLKNKIFFLSLVRPKDIYLHFLK